MATFVYLDETGPVGTSFQKQPFLTLVGVLVPEDRVQLLAQQLRDLTIKHLGWIPADFEWHGRDVWHATGHWKQKAPPALLAAYQDVIAIVDRLDLHVAHSTIDKPKLRDRYQGTSDANAYRLALQFLLEKLERNVGGFKVVVADETKQEQVYAQQMVMQMQQWSWGGEVPGRQLKTIIDSLHFVRSEASPGVQLADMVAYILQREERGAHHPDAQSALTAMSAVIRFRTATYRLPWPS